MTALKIFISHSSRLRPGDADNTQALAHWQLLQQVCGELEAVYGNTVEIVVDYQGLRPSDDWEQRLNQWLAECHAALLLLSPRAIGESQWVRKEATILTWRAQLDPQFKRRLFPVLIDAGSAAAQLDEDPYFRMLNLTRTQCVQEAATAQEIVAAIRPRLGEPGDLGSSSDTPYDRLVGAVAHTLAADTNEQSLDAAWSELFPGVAAPAAGQPDRLASLSRRLATHLLNRGEESLERFQTMLDKLRPRPLRERAEELLKTVRPLWIALEAAGLLPAAAAHRRMLALNGALVGLPEEKLGTRHFTLDRYLERAWPGSDRIKVIPVSDVGSAERMQQQIRRGYHNGIARPSDAFIDQKLSTDKRHLIVFVADPALTGNIPDARLLHDIARVQQEYRTLTFIFHIGEQMPAALPDELLPLLPAVDPDLEWNQYAAELQARELIDRKYGRATA